VRVLDTDESTVPSATASSFVETQQPTPSALVMMGEEPAIVNAAVQEKPLSPRSLERDNTARVPSPEIKQTTTTTTLYVSPPLTSSSEIGLSQPKTSMKTEETPNTLTRKETEQLPTPSALAISQGEGDRSQLTRSETSEENSLIRQPERKSLPTLLGGENDRDSLDIEEKEDSPHLMYGGEEFLNQPQQIQKFQMAQPELMMGKGKYMMSGNQQQATSTSQLQSEGALGDVNVNPDLTATGRD